MTHALKRYFYALKYFSPWSHYQIGYINILKRIFQSRYEIMLICVINQFNSSVKLRYKVRKRKSLNRKVKNLRAEAII